MSFYHTFFWTVFYGHYFDQPFTLILLLLIYAECKLICFGSLEDDVHLLNKFFFPLLQLLEMLMNNCGEHIHKQVIDNGLLPVLVKIVKKKVDYIYWIWTFKFYLKLPFSSHFWLTDNFNYSILCCPDRFACLWENICSSGCYSDCPWRCFWKISSVLCCILWPGGRYYKIHIFSWQLFYFLRQNEFPMYVAVERSNSFTIVIFS